MKKTLWVLMCLCLIFTFASCGEEAESSETVYEESFDDEGSSWKPSLLSKAGLAHMEEPEGEKVFTEDENGNVTFTVTPADADLLSGLGSCIFSEISNYTDSITPMLFTEALESETHFKVSYTLNSTKVSVELTLEDNVLNAQIIYS